MLLLFRYGSDELVALLNDTNIEPARLIGERIRDAIRATPLSLESKSSVPVDVEVIAVSCPEDGDSLEALISTARELTAARTADRDASTTP